MPTIDIPDKICPHCGGIRWAIESYRTLKKGVVSRYVCAKVRSERSKKYNILHKEKISLYNKKRTFNGRHKNPEKRNYYKLRSEKERLELSDNYVKKVIALSIRRTNSINLKQNDISQELVELKRKQLLLKRKIKNNG